LKYKLIGENNYQLDYIIDEILKNRGIENRDRFLNINEDILTDPHRFKNMDKAVKCLLEHIEKEHWILIIIDRDTDGITSATLIYNYIKNTLKYDKIKFITHTHKTHGIIIEEFRNILYDIKLIIVPDGGSENYKQHKYLKKINKDIIILDHHPVKYESVNAIVVNNQISDIAVNLCGVAMVHKFCKALDSEIWENDADNYLDITALGLIADMMDMKDLEVQWYVRNGLENIRNKGFQALIDEQDFSIKGVLNPMTIGFYIAPLINSVQRLGSKEEVEEIFKSFVGIDSEKKFIYIPKTGKNKGQEIEETIYKKVARMCVSYNGKRQRLSTKITKELSGNVDLNNKILVIDIGEYGEKGMSRLIANGFQRQYAKPTIVYYKSKSGKFKGSMASNTGDFKDRLNETGLFKFVAGHQDASGLEIKKNKVEVLINELNKAFANATFEKINMVDFVIPFDELNSEIVEEIYDLHDYFGQKFEEPLIVIENIKLSPSEINLIGTNKNTIEIKAGEIKYIKFNSSQIEYDDIVGWEDVISLNILGRCSINEYQGKRYPQIIISEYEKINKNINEESTDDWEW
jgi:single-stranded-DNA-specific exonuclease